MANEKNVPNHQLVLAVIMGMQLTRKGRFNKFDSILLMKHVESPPVENQAAIGIPESLLICWHLTAEEL